MTCSVSAEPLLLLPNGHFFSFYPVDASSQALSGAALASPVIQPSNLQPDEAAPYEKPGGRSCCAFSDEKKHGLNGLSLRTDLTLVEVLPENTDIAI